MGKCLCKANIVGDKCEECAIGYAGHPICDSCATQYFGYHTDSGCQACSCNEKGSQSLICDATTGLCDCKENIIGDNCDQCEFGFYISDNGTFTCQGKYF